MTTYTDSLIITETMRRYNTKTSRYESVVTKRPDPWEGAPRGIRLTYRNLYLDVISNDGYFRRKLQSDTGFWKLKDDPNPQWEVAAAQRTGWHFPDFDGAPKGQRFYVQWGSNSAFEPGVDTGDGVHVLIRGKWWKQSGVYGLKWYRDDGIKLILVDPTPEEPKPIPSEKFYYYDLVGRGDKLNADEVRQAHLVIAVDKAGKVRVEKSRHFAQPVN